MRQLALILGLLFASAAFGQVAVPTFSVAPGVYATTQNVSLSDATGGAAICYTLSGILPTAGVAGTCDAVDATYGLPIYTYSTAIPVTTSAQITAIGTKAANTNSTGAYAAYSITGSGNGTDGPANLPTLLSTTFPSTTGYTVVTVCASSCTYTTINAAYTAVGCKTVIRIRAGATFTESLNATKTCTAGNWIIFMSDNCTSAGVCTNLPAQGTRATPSVQPYMATWTAPNTSNLPTIALGVSGGGVAYHWFGPGLEITGPVDGVTSNGGAVVQDDSSVTTGTGISNIVVDRSYIHCATGQQCVRGWGMTGASESLIDSYVTDFHYQGAQSQAAGEYGGVGPYKFTNNYLGGMGEAIFSGGSGCYNGTITAHDFEIRGNYITYSLGTSPLGLAYYVAHGGIVRALLEMKEGQRALIEGNYFDGSALAGQSASNYGYGILIRAASNSACHIITSDVTVRYNYTLSNVETTPLQGNSPIVDPSYGFYNISVHDNLYDNLNATNGIASLEFAYYIDSTNSFAGQVLATTNVTFNHNTAISSDPSINSRFWAYIDCNNILVNGQVQVTNNIGFNGIYGIGGENTGSTIYGVGGPNACMPNGYTWTYNVNDTVNANYTSYPPTQAWPSQNSNFYPNTIAAVGFTNYNAGSGGNYQLTSGSAYHHAGSDGLDIGVAYWTCTNNETAAALAGTWTESLACGANGPLNPAPGSQLTGATLKGAQIH